MGSVLGFQKKIKEKSNENKNLFESIAEKNEKKRLQMIKDRKSKNESIMRQYGIIDPWADTETDEDLEGKPE